MKSNSLVGFIPLFASLAAAVPFAQLKARFDNTTSRFSQISLHSDATTSSSWFLPNLDHTSGPVRGYVPALKDNNGNPVYDYPSYIAVNSGDSNGFVDALHSKGPKGDRDSMWLVGQPRVIYLAPGTYTLSQTAIMYTDTVIIGDAANPPTIKAASGFNGDYLLAGGAGFRDKDTHGELHFSVMIKNVILDTTANSGNGQFTALSWRVAQNSALVNVNINMPQGSHTGIYLGQGSTISVADVTFNYGSVGFHYAGHQQAQLKNFQFNKCSTGILIDGGNTIQILAPVCNTVGRCVVLNSGNPWVSVVDGKSVNSGDFFTSNVGYPNFMIENISKDTSSSNMVTVSGKVKVGGDSSIGTYIYGNTYGKDPVYQQNPKAVNVNRPAAIAPGGRYPVVSAPQYADKTTADVVNLKDVNQNGGFNLHGDGVIDDTQALQGAINTAAQQGKVAYLPFGIYNVTSTITIPPGSEIYGEAWSSISGWGSAFADESNPRPIVRVGTEGSKGVARLQDLRFTVGQPLPGAIILQVNMAGNSPGDVGIFNSMITVGGTRSTTIDCDSETNCRAAYLGIHLSSTSSAYIDNFWSWVADHASDDTTRGTRSAGKGGVLVEATAGTWLALGSEHWWLYQINFNNAKNVFVSFFQSETNYNQGDKAVVTAPAPFKPTSSDPDYSWCAGSTNVCPMGLAQLYNGGSDIYHYAAGSWNFFGGTQATMNYIKSNVNNAHLHGFTTHETHYTFKLPGGNRMGDSQDFGGSWGTLVADVASQS